MRRSSRKTVIFARNLDILRSRRPRIALKGSSSTCCVNYPFYPEVFLPQKQKPQLQSCKVVGEQQLDIFIFTLQPRGGDETLRWRPPTRPQRMPFHSKVTRPQAKSPSTCEKQRHGPFVKMGLGFSFWYKKASNTQKESFC